MKGTSEGHDSRPAKGISWSLLESGQGNRWQCYSEDGVSGQWREELTVALYTVSADMLEDA
jgi:hypothetical protein